MAAVFRAGVAGMSVERFVAWLQGAEPEEKIKAAGSLAACWHDQSSDRETLALLEGAMTLLADDPDESVREALAVAVCELENAPRHIIHMLAEDQEAIAGHVLAHSPVLIEAELIDHVLGGSEANVSAIARRICLQQAVCERVANHGDRDACETLLQNTTAETGAEALHAVASRFGADAELRRAVLRHANTAPRTRVLLIFEMSKAMAAEASLRSDLSRQRIEAMVREADERALLTLAARVEPEELDEVVGEIVNFGRLSASFLLRSVCAGNLQVIVRALALLAELPADRVEAAVFGRQSQSFAAIYRRAGLPANAYGAFTAAIGAWRAVEKGLVSPNPHVVACFVSEAVLGACSDGDNIPASLLVLSRKLAADAKREHARRETAMLIEAENTRTKLLAAPKPKDLTPIDVAPQVLTAFAMFLAEEIIEMEGTAEAELPIEVFEAEPHVAVNDDVPLEEFSMDGFADGGRIAA